MSLPAIRSLTIIIAIILISGLCYAADYTVTLTWDKNIEPVDGYHIYRTNESSNYAEGNRIATIDNSSDFPSYVDTITQIGTYYWVVTAFIGVYESSYSNEVSKFVGILNAPTGLQVE